MLKIHGECLQEECAEVIQAMSKIFRFGLDQRHPGTGVTNKDHLAVELDQLQAMIDIVRDRYSIRISDYEYVKKVNNHYSWIKSFPAKDTVQFLVPKEE